MSNVTIQHSAMSLLEKLSSNDQASAKSYYIFNPVEARIVFSYLKITKTYGRDISISFWDKSKEKIAFKKMEGEFASKPFPALAPIKEHQVELEKLLEQPIDQSCDFYKEVILSAKGDFGIAAKA